MAFTAKILSWRFRYLNIVGCLLKRRPTKGGSRAPQEPPPLATPLRCNIVLNGYNIVPALQRYVGLKIVVANRPV